jgi:hypothetical protein
MKKIMPKRLLAMSEQVFVYGGIGLTLLVELFVVLMVYFETLDTNVLPGIAVINAVIGVILLDRALKSRKELDKVKETELVREIIKELKQDGKKHRKH